MSLGYHSPGPDGNWGDGWAQQRAREVALGEEILAEMMADEAILRAARSGNGHCPILAQIGARPTGAESPWYGATTSSWLPNPERLGPPERQVRAAFAARAALRPQPYHSPEEWYELLCRYGAGQTSGMSGGVKADLAAALEPAPAAPAAPAAPTAPTAPTAQPAPTTAFGAALLRAGVRP